MSKKQMNKMLYNRLLSYLRYMKQLPEDAPDNISSSMISAALGIYDVQVRKDLALVSDKGKPKIGYIRKELIQDIECFLGYDKFTEAAIVGVGNLGHALLSYENFEKYGLRIVAAFDTDPKLIGTTIGKTKVIDAEKISNLCERLGIRIGIITVPSQHAQDVCDRLVQGGVKAIWNFAPIDLQVPDDVIVKNEDLVASLAVLTRQLIEKSVL
ncbi:MAG TPA: redox-sensing transcriptional repressor Rex [Clostridiales bacterium]|jgi:redox-sensing transcriptional repressor|nr:redox-sensing transcriptional repressor Rex [Clostridiales bacterium]